MRPIPPMIWTLAITVGRIHRAIDETNNVILFDSLRWAQDEIDRFLKSTRRNA